jgi:hypothetical protein
VHQRLLSSSWPNSWSATKQFNTSLQLVTHTVDRSNPLTGEEVDVASSKSDLLCQLALRRVREKLAVVRFPLRLTFTGSRRLRRYLTVPVDVDGVGFADFLLEAMTYNAVIIPEFRERLGLSGTDGEAVRAMGSNGPTVRQRVALPQMWLGRRHTHPGNQMFCISYAASSWCCSRYPVSTATHQTATSCLADSGTCIDCTAPSCAASACTAQCQVVV